MSDKVVASMLNGPRTATNEQEEALSEQKPTVGRQVHYYGNDLVWHQNGDTKRPSPPSEEWSGPFAATIVHVHEGGDVNLRVDYPCPMYPDGEGISEIRQNVRYFMDVHHHTGSLPGGADGYWVWPPRLP